MLVPPMSDMEYEIQVRMLIAVSFTKVEYQFVRFRVNVFPVTLLWPLASHGTKAHEARTASFAQAAGM